MHRRQLKKYGKIMGVFPVGERKASQHPLYHTWKAMKSRCNNKNDSAYRNYGGRGIKVCERWQEPHEQGFWNFVSDMGPKPNPSEDYSLDRIDVNGDYCSENCRWVNRHQQNINRRDSEKKEYCIYEYMKHGRYLVYRVNVRKKGVRLAKEFKTLEEAEEWRDEKLEELWG